MADSRDRLLAGRYRLIEQIGRGGMGTVWWAHDEVEDREVAVKEVHLPPSLDHRERMNLLRRTDREALAAGRLRHPGLISIYDMVIEESRPYLIMEYVAARSLEDVFVDDGPISPRRVAEIGVQLLAALSAAHDAGIVHRDVKPSNVLLETSGRVVLTDFGIATYDGATTLTQTGSFMGSPAYVAPEVARGEPASPSSDLWSLGATLYAAVEGRPPYDHETAMATLSALVTSEPDPPLRAGPLRPVLEGLLTKEPARRLGAGHAAELLALAATPPVPPRQPQRTRRGLAERAGVVPVVTVGVLALAVGAGVLAGVKGRPALYSGDPAPSGSPAAPPSGTPSATPRGDGGPLPATIGGEAGAPSVTRLARGGASWPATSTLTLRLDEDARDGAERVSVVVTCPSGPRRLSFTAYAVGDPRSLVRGTCAATGADAPMTRSLRLPAGGSPARIRVRVRPGPDARSGPVAWYAGVYGAA
ncbi:serine/threonine protein kinase [Actinoallomurus bryophytorum]|uniref:non-specific serine/threonine protein kinase n=1 Tax=Actinoallomurus bryophytorum TaxID=1490222 RepID=A0A543CFA1_9ACTN|nr:serine/threonine-protein kinase [Actinoallomurus bryophytorum]TQL95786.1 serine/threonine protein kinase [Actinoallomurus bryophytorum]